MTVFFTSDTHFGHARSIELCRRPFADVVEMRETMIANWNAVVRADDEVYHLGDFAYRCDGAEVERIFDRLNGKKHLIPGNHDSLSVCTGLEWKSVADICPLTVEGQRVVLCHYPLLEWQGYYRQAIHLFGHVHGNRPGVGRSCDVGVDSWDFRPVRLSEILERIGGAVNE